MEKCNCNNCEEQSCNKELNREEMKQKTADFAEKNIQLKEYKAAILIGTPVKDKTLPNVYINGSVLDTFQAITNALRVSPEIAITIKEALAMVEISAGNEWNERVDKGIQLFRNEIAEQLLARISGNVKELMKDTLDKLKDLHDGDLNESDESNEQPKEQPDDFKDVLEEIRKEIKEEKQPSVFDKIKNLIK